jgi:hypothetical protein
MLRGLYRQHYQTLRQKVSRLKEIVDHRSSIADFAGMFTDVRQQAGISVAEDFDGTVQSYQTEINKQLRLLEMDLMFLKTARQAATLEQRWSGMGDRIHLLTLYCDALLTEENQTDGDHPS